MCYNKGSLQRPSEERVLPFAPFKQVPVGISTQPRLETRISSLLTVSVIAVNSILMNRNGDCAAKMMHGLGT